MLGGTTSKFEIFLADFRQQIVGSYCAKVLHHGHKLGPINHVV